MPSYIDRLPDAVCRKVYSYLYDNVMHELETDGGVPVYPIAFYYCFTRQNSDYVRFKYLNDAYALTYDRTMNVRERDWYKFILDLERPTMWTSILEPWNYLLIRHCHTGGGIRWFTAYDPPKLTMGGWCRLCDEE